MTQTLTRLEGSTGSLGLRHAFRVGSVLTAVGSASYIAVGILVNGTPRQNFQHPISWVGCIITTIGFLTLAVALLRWKTTLPNWAVLTAATSLFFGAAHAWFAGTATVGLAEVASEETFWGMAQTGWFLLWWAPKMVFGLVGFGALSIAGWRSSAIPRRASIVLFLSAVLAVWPPYPPGAILASLAFYLVSAGPVATRR